MILLIIVGGRASNLALATAKAGWKTALIEKDKLGGTCPNRGCVPSRLLIGFSEVASVGLTEDAVQTKGIPYVAITEDWQASARAMALREDYPLTKLIVSTEDYSILGCHLVGP